MITVVLVIHLILAFALIGSVLLQKSEGGALGMGGGGMSGFMTGRSTANLLTRTTAILAALFFATSITLAILSGSQRGAQSVIDLPPVGQPVQPPLKTVPMPNGAAPSPAAPAAPSAPSAPATAPSGSAPSGSTPAQPAAPAAPSAPLAK